MIDQKKTQDPYDLLPLYRRLETTIPSEQPKQMVWLRIHLLLQGYQAVMKNPCPPHILQELLSGKLTRLVARMPLIRELLALFPLPGEAATVTLPKDLLSALCDIYQNPTIPDLGQLYQTIQSPAHLKQKGQMFTSHAAVRHAFSLLPQRLEGRLLDLACGAGDYLLVAYEHWSSHYEAEGLDREQAHQVILSEHLYGIDQDPLAVAITTCRLALLCPHSQVLAAHIVTLNAYQIFEHPLGKQDYQVIVGNPPWGGRISPDEKRWIREHTQLPKGTVTNSFVYFLEAAVRLTGASGQFSLLVPAALLNVQSYRLLREWLLTQVRLTALHYVPNLFPACYVPALFLSGSKSTPIPDHHVTIYPSSRSWSQWYMSPKPPGKRVRQEQFASAPQTIFNIHHDPRLEPLFAKMRDGACYLQSKRSSKATSSGQQARVDFVVGIITGNNKRWVSKERLDAESSPIYRAPDVGRFTLHPPTHYIRYDKHKLRQAAPDRKFKVPEKLLYRFISKELVTAIDRSGSYTLNNTNFLIPVSLPISLRTLSALLNSILLNTYYMYHFFTGKVISAHLCLMPLRVPPAEMAQEIDQLVERLEQGEDLEAWREINEVIYRLYAVSPLKQQWVEQTYQHLRQFPFI